MYIICLYIQNWKPDTFIKLPGRDVKILNARLLRQLNFWHWCLDISSKMKNNFAFNTLNIYRFPPPPPYTKKKRTLSFLSMNWTVMHRNVGKTKKWQGKSLSRGLNSIVIYHQLLLWLIHWLDGDFVSVKPLRYFCRENELQWSYLCAFQTALSYVVKCMCNCIVTPYHLCQFRSFCKQTTYYMFCISALK